ncbi:phage portal protein [Clostridium perfringens]|uniref:terminase small subunit n=1 Tax=Clostridium perfringens TaxID=1502 RepID=UPI001CAF33C2|nr:terminase small subunit [Clostridium perfringens]MDK0718752.1 terminase small subunit [Clostridium perfringens]MDU1597809.1 terminase small subunit [Clostridium perfringens]UBK61536.1 terminase small subunit [Clostridium perfringens]UYC93771.1 terminase small subunit [Clostridium perfringens]STB61764.1 terminase small subunit [Clostridium perfringens]
MARARSPNRDKAFEIYKDYDGNITNREIADMLDENEKTISNWKCRDKWNVVLQKNECSTTNKKVQKNTDNNIKKEPIAEEVKEVLGNTELTDKQRLFCIYYIKYFNATKAYQKAYNSSYIVANSEGYKLLVNPCIKSEIEKLKQHKLNQAMLSEEDIFQRYMDIAFSDITDYVNFGKREIEVSKDEDDNPVMIEVNYVDFKDSNEVDGTIISEISQGKNGVSIKLHDKMKALQWLSDHMNIATDKQKAELEVLKSKIVNNEKSKEDKIDEYFAKLEEGIRNA